MSHNPHHEHLIKEVEDIFAPLLSKSPQAIYIYLDDEHKFCNAKFAKLLGYKNSQDWVKNLFPVSDVDKKDQATVIKAYKTTSGKLTVSNVSATVTTKAGKKIRTDVTMVPFLYSDEVFVLHFIQPAG